MLNNKNICNVWEWYIWKIDWKVMEDVICLFYLIGVRK